MSNSNIDTTECALCGAELTPIEVAWEWGTEVNNPGGSWIDDALDQLGLDRSDETCIPCWWNRVHSLAWELCQADEDEDLR